MSTLPKYSIAPQLETIENPLIRLDEGLFTGTLFSFKNIRLIECDNLPELMFDNEFYNVVVNGGEIALEEHENMNIANIISGELADKLYNEYIFPIFQDLLVLYCR